MVNAYRDHYRRQQRSMEVQPFEGEHARDANVIEAAVSPEPNPEALLGHKHFSEATQAAIASLSPEVRLVVTLFFVEGLAYKEIAEIADCPIGTVMSRLARGRRRLQEQLREHHDTSQAPTETSSLAASSMPAARQKARRGRSGT